MAAAVAPEDAEWSPTSRHRTESQVVNVLHAVCTVDIAAFLTTFSMALSAPRALLRMAETVTGIMLKQTFLGNEQFSHNYIHYTGT